MAILKVCLFGKLSLHCDADELAGFDARKLQQLFCYLLIHRDHPHPREVLAGVLWGNNSTEQSKKYLRQTLWQLQSALDRGSDRSGNFITVDADWVNLNSSRDLWLDVAIFEDAFLPVKDVQGHDLGDEKAQQLERAVQLYHGDLLEGWYEDWCLFERERLQNMYLAMLDKLMSYCEANEQYETGIVYGTRILSFDRAREHTHQHLMRLQYRAGNRTAALRQYERCTLALEEELGVKPAKSTQVLYEQIRNDHVDDRSTPPHFSSRIDSPAQDILNRLDLISELLTDVQRATQRGLCAIELVTKTRR